MSRTKGSLNKPSGKSLYSINLEKTIDNAPITKNSNRGWINYGLKNTYPYDLLSLYNSSVSHRACIDFGVNSIIGNGVDYEMMKSDSGDLVPNYQYTWDTFIRNISLDFLIYGSFAFQIIRNKDNKTYSFYHQPFETVRYAPRDEDGVITSYYICEDWTMVGKYQPIELPSFGFQEDSTIDNNKAYLYVYQDYSPSNVYYPSPNYNAAIKAIQAEVEYLKYDLRSITNSFVPSGILNLKYIEDDEERAATINRFQNMFIGADNTNNLMINFVKNEDDKIVTFTPLVTSNTNVDLYKEANNRSVDRILAGHRITSKGLIGYPMDSGGFSNQGELLEIAYKLYNINIGNKNRDIIINSINNALQLNGIETQIILKPLSFIIDNNTNTNELVNTTTDETTEKITNINPIQE